MSRGARRERLRNRLTADGLDALLVTSRANVRYLTGFTGSAGALLVGTGTDVLATDGRYLERAAAETDVALLDRRGLAWVGELLESGTRLGVESHDLAWQDAIDLTAAVGDGVDVVPAPRHVEALRAVKDTGELRLIAHACAIGDKAFTGLLGWLAPGLTEHDVARRLEAALVEAGAEAPAFSAIVAGGPNGSRPHHSPGPRPLARGDLVTIDFGAQVDGYVSDMTRTVALGPPSARLRGLYGVVADAQAAGVAAVAAGAAAGMVDAACRNLIAAAGHADHFVHPTGHALGLEIHEEPILREGSDARLSPRMAVTVEPGVYVPGLGGVRIEDTVVVDNPGGSPQVLTRTPKDLLVV